MVRSCSNAAAARCVNLGSVDVVDELQAQLGPGGWVGTGDAAPNLIDWRGRYSGTALGVARPSSTDEVATVMRVCSRHGVAVVAQGGNTGLAGGSVPSEPRPTIVLSLTRMRAIEEVNPDQFTITAEAGVTVQALQEAAARADRLFAPDWGARGTATLGGTLATNAGGVNVLRYGTTRDQVLGLEVVLADGRVWNGLRALTKDNSGYDLKHLFIASEGTLGVITRATMKLHPAAAEQRTAFVALADVDQLAGFFSLASAHRPGALSAFELIPEIGVSRVVERYGVSRPLATISDWYVLMRYSGPSGVGDDLLDLLSVAAEAGYVTDAVIADLPAHEENLWLLRDELPPPRIFDGFMIKYDLAVPIDRIADFHRRVAELITDRVPGALPYAFGHVGDGNLHLTVVAADSDTGVLQRDEADLIADIDALTWEFGGTISAEHGLGQELRGRIVGQKPAVEFDLMRGIKSLLDPDGLLNPGKVLPDTPT